MQVSFYKTTIIQWQLCNKQIKQRTKDNGLKGEARRQEGRICTAVCGTAC